MRLNLRDVFLQRITKGLSSLRAVLVNDHALMSQVKREGLEVSSNENDWLPKGMSKAHFIIHIGIRLRKVGNNVVGFPNRLKNVFNDHPRSKYVICPTADV